VIAYAGGGALDTVIPGKTGVLFHELTVESLMAAMQSFGASAYDPAVIRIHAERFDTAVFKQQITDYIDKRLNARSQQRGDE
jgi:hypothetical protein